MMFTGCRKGMMDETQEGASERANMGKGTVLREETALVQQCFASVQKLPRLWRQSMLALPGSGSGGEDAAVRLTSSFRTGSFSVPQDRH